MPLVNPFNLFFSWLGKRHASAPEQLERLREQLPVNEAKILYVMPFHSRVLIKLIRTLCKHHRLPVPTRFVNPLATREGFEKQRSSITSIRKRSGDETVTIRARRHRQLLREYFEEKTKRAERDFLVPVEILAGRGPNPLPVTLRLPLDFYFFPLGEIWTLLVLLYYRGSLRLDIGPAIPTTSSRPLNRLAKEFYRKRKAARGARRQPYAISKSLTLSGRRFERAVKSLALRTSEYSAKLQAEQIFAEMHGTIRQPMITLIRVLSRPAIKQIFGTVQAEGLDCVRRALAKHPVVLLPNHRSHFDSLLISYVLDREGLALPFVAAGKNLDFFPAGFVIRNAGGFFIRRKLTDDPLYKAVLEGYIVSLLKQGHMVQFYMDGGRSRNGGPREPKLGLLKYVLRAVIENVRRDVVFVPVGITYERIPEEQSIVAELGGKKKEKETAGQMLALGAVRNLGSVRISFGEPVSARLLIGSFSPPHQRSDQPADLAIATQEIGLRSVSRIQDLLAISAHGLISAALLTGTNKDTAVESLIARMWSVLRTAAISRGLQQAANLNLDNFWSDYAGLEGVALTPALSSAEPEQTIRKKLESLVEDAIKEGFLGKGKVSGQFLPAEDLLLYEYYKNGIAHLILPAVMACLSAQCASPEDERPEDFLYTLFQRAMVLPLWNDWSRRTHTARAYLEHAHWLIADKDDFNLTLAEAGGDVALCSRLLLPYFHACAAAAAEAKGAAEVSEEDFRSRVAQRFTAGAAKDENLRIEGLNNLYVRFGVDALLSFGGACKVVFQSEGTETTRLYFREQEQQALEAFSRRIDCLTDVLATWRSIVP